MKDFSLKNAFGFAAAALGAEALIGTGYAVWHHAHGHLETLKDAFLYVAQPTTLLAGAVLAIAIGAGGELINRYHKTLDQEDFRRQKFQRPAGPQK